MTTTHKTFTVRGKQPITELKPNFTYAVEYTISPDEAFTNGIKKEQVGLIHTNEEGIIDCNFNVSLLDRWLPSAPDLEGKKVWKASAIEQEAMNAWLSYQSSLRRSSKILDDLRTTELAKKRLELDLMYMRRHRLVRWAYRFSEWINDIILR